MEAVILTNGETVWDHVCMLVAETFNTCCKILLILLCGSSEHFLKLSLQFGAFDGDFVVNVKSWICGHMHFRYFNFNEVM